jgi:hypothetical protein
MKKGNHSIVIKHIFYKKIHYIFCKKINRFFYESNLFLMQNTTRQISTIRLFLYFSGYKFDTNIGSPKHIK